MALHLIGLGLHDAKDITLRGLERVKGCGHLYLDVYTSQMGVAKAELEAAWGVTIHDALRSLLEEGSAALLRQARHQDVGILIPGDAFSATTHYALVLDAKAAGVPVTVTHNASVLTAVADIGLDLYRFGRTVTLVAPSEDYFPESPYEQMAHNVETGLHTLILLDTRSAEGEALMIPDAVAQLLEMERRQKKGMVTAETRLVGAARLGGDAKIVFSPAAALATVDFGPPPHCLIRPGALSAFEEEALRAWRA